jgi:hypothetical protein
LIEMPTILMSLKAERWIMCVDWQTMFRICCLS